ncbi:MAG: hypothetical protein HY697_00335 [Deltaproteobacteria bacterium]|nr:hypothetical protein [Deltaproteobacteria bacterium]
MSEREIRILLDRLRKEVRGLREEIDSLKDRERAGLMELKGMLRRRGLNPFRENPVHHLLFPPTFSASQRNSFYALFGRYSFRLFLREILARKEGFRLSEVVRYSSPETGRRYLRSLIELALVDPAGGRRFRLRPVPTASLGPTLEWFMAETMRREFTCPALYGLRCRGTRFGGDYDVVAGLEGQLVYLEAKSSPPKNIHGEEVHAFFGRLRDLLPHLALFFVDTELRLKDKIVPLFEAERRAEDPRPAAGVQRIADEIFFAPPRIYILGSKRSIVRNIEACFQHHFTFLSPSPGNGAPDRIQP